MRDRHSRKVRCEDGGYTGSAVCPFLAHANASSLTARTCGALSSARNMGTKERTAEFFAVGLNFARQVKIIPVPASDTLFYRSNLCLGYTIR